MSVVNVPPNYSVNCQLLTRMHTLCRNFLSKNRTRMIFVPSWSAFFFYAHGEFHSNTSFKMGMEPRFLRLCGVLNIDQLYLLSTARIKVLVQLLTTCGYLPIRALVKTLPDAIYMMQSTHTSISKISTFYFLKLLCLLLINSNNNINTSVTY